MLEQLLKKIKELEAEARGYLELMQKENRALTDEEQSKYDAAMNEIDTQSKQVENLRRMQQFEKRGYGEQGKINPVDNGGSNGRIVVGDDNGGNKKIEFRSLDDFVFCALNPRERWPKEYRDMQMSQGEKGGFMIPTQHREELMKLEAAESIVRKRARVISPGPYPDAELLMPALTQGDEGVYGGVVMSWIGEGQLKPKKDFKLHQISLIPKELAGHILATDQLLQNSSAIGMFIREILVGSLAETEDVAFLVGDGIGKPLGVLRSPCALAVNRDTAGTVVFEDLTAMKKSMLPRSLRRAVWNISQSLMDSLDELVDPNGNYIYTGANPEKGTPATLLGIPVEFTGNVPAAGDEGDVSLVDFSYYLIKDGSGPFVAASDQQYFTENQTVIKAYMRVDGQCWVRDPLLLRDGVTRVSPVVILK